MTTKTSRFLWIMGAGIVAIFVGTLLDNIVSPSFSLGVCVGVWMIWMLEKEESNE